MCASLMTDRKYQAEFPAISKVLASITRLYISAIVIGLTLLPAIVIWYLDYFSFIPALKFENHGFHEIVIAIATLVGGFISYVSWRSYLASGEIFLRWLTTGFLAFTLIYAPHGLLTGMAHHNIWLFILYGPVSRLAMLGCLIYGLMQYGKPAESPADVEKRGFWRRVLIVCVLVDLAVAVLAYSPIAGYYWMRTSMELGAMVLALIGIGIVIRRNISSPLMKFYIVSLAIFGQADIAFMLAKPWEHMWWLAHVIFSVGFFILSWGVARALLTTRSFELAYSEEELTEQIRNLAFYDTLTQLSNRRLLKDRLEQAMNASKRSGLYGAILFLDLDNFKPLNDLHGHIAGDSLLIEVANRLKNCVRKIDTVARFGGDEFVVMLTELNADKAESTSQAMGVAEKIRCSLAKPYHLSIDDEKNAGTRVEHHCSVSVGVTLFKNAMNSQEAILKQADSAMYQAKAAGRNLIVFYDMKD